MLFLADSIGSVVQMSATASGAASIVFRRSFSSSPGIGRIFSSARSHTASSLSSSAAGPSRIPIPRTLSGLQLSRRHATTYAARPTASPINTNLPLSSRPKISVTPPSLQTIKEEGYLDDDVQLIPPDQAMMIITPEAVTVCRLLITSSPSSSRFKQLAEEKRHLFWSHVW